MERIETDVLTSTTSNCVLPNSHTRTSSSMFPLMRKAKTFDWEGESTVWVTHCYSRLPTTNISASNPFSPCASRRRLLVGRCCGTAGCRPLPPGPKGRAQTERGAGHRERRRWAEPRREGGDHAPGVVAVLQMK